MVSWSAERIGPMTIGAPHRGQCQAGGVEDVCAWWRGPSEKAPGERETRGAAGAGEIAKLPNADEATWEHVLDEAPEKLHRGERHRAPLIAAGVILPLKGHTLAIEGDQAVVADRDPMRVAPQIPQHR